MNLTVRHGDLSEVTTVRGLRATTLARTFRDLSRRLPAVEVLVLADEALRKGLGRFHELAQPADSPMETRLRFLLLSRGLPTPEVQQDLYGDAGEFLGRADLYYSSAHLVVEFDGGNHRDRLIGDDRRQNLLVGAGYRILRFTTADLRHRPDAVLAQVRAALGASKRPKSTNRSEPGATLQAVQVHDPQEKPDQRGEAPREQEPRRDRGQAER
jgi:hypothetical protein